jgi:Tfp pilus assembly protein PilV
MKCRIAHNECRRERGGRPAANVRTSHFSLLTSHLQSAFTLLEVIIASAIFFMVAIAILQLVTQGLSSAKSLQVRHPDPGMVLAALSLSNAFEEGSISGNYEDIAPATYPGYRWEAEIYEIQSNGLFEIQVMTFNTKKPGVGPATIAGQFWRPMSKPGSVTKGGF